jgi:hypothetical protein
MRNQTAQTRNHLACDRRQFLHSLSLLPALLSAQTLLSTQAIAQAKVLDRSAVLPAEQAKVFNVLSVDHLQILGAAAQAPSGHNTQPWVVDVVEPGHWLIGIAPSRLLPAVDPHNREATLSIGAFLENLIMAAGQIGYSVYYRVIAKRSTDLHLIDLKLTKSQLLAYPMARLKMRRTVRNGFSDQLIKADDLKAVTDGSEAFALHEEPQMPAIWRKQPSRRIGSRLIVIWRRQSWQIGYAGRKQIKRAFAMDLPRRAWKSTDSRDGMCAISTVVSQ